MTLQLTISSDAEARLREKAAAAGASISDYAAQLLERAVSRPLTIADISGPISAEFDRSGMSEDQLSGLLEAAKHDMRKQKRQR